MLTDVSLHILGLAEQCISLEKQERPEVIWLKDKYEKFRTRHKLKSKKAADSLLFEKMYGFFPTKNTETLKIRYWRTGQHVPGNREQCLLFGTALELSHDEMQYLIQNYYDRSSDIFCDEDTESDIYLQKLSCLKEITTSYLQRISTSQTERYYNLRHLYFTDAYNYVHALSPVNSSILQKHINSTHYDSEFTRHLKLIGEIPRKSMIRHLIIFNMPELTLEKLNQQLQFFGYLPLTETHTLVTGEHLDWLLIQFIRKYEKNRTLMSQEMCTEWFQEASRTLDYFFMKENKPHLRFMHFKALDL